MNNLQHNRHQASLERITSVGVFSRVIGGLFFSTSLMAFAQSGNNDGEWTSYAADAGSTKYTSLGQIDADNFEQRKIKNIIVQFIVRSGYLFVWNLFPADCASLNQFPHVNISF